MFKVADKQFSINYLFGRVLRTRQIIKNLIIFISDTENNKRIKYVDFRINFGNCLMIFAYQLRFLFENQRYNTPLNIRHILPVILFLSLKKLISNSSKRNVD